MSFYFYLSQLQIDGHLAMKIQSLIGFALGIIGVARGGCPSGWWSGQGSSCYYFETKIKLPMEDAETYCQELYGSHLTSVLDQGEIGYLRGKTGNTEFWIGLRQKADQTADLITAFEWLDGSKNNGFNQFWTGYSYSKS